MESSKNNKFYYLKSTLQLIKNKRFIKFKKYIKKNLKNLRILIKKLDFSSFDLVIEALKTDE